MTICPGREDGIMLLGKPVRRVAIVGTGVIGASWTTLCLARGFDVIATDPAPDAEANLRRFVDTAWPTQVALGLSPKASPEHLCFTARVSHAVADADFIQESGPEQSELKIDLFARIDEATHPDSIIASSSSGLTMTAIQSACKRPERCVIGHPFNPPHIMPLVEVVGGAKTSPETVQKAMSFYGSIGKNPIHLRKEVVGHAANRLQAALYREVINLIDQGVLDVAGADAAVCWGPGLRWGVMGPNLLFHLGAGQGGIRHFLEQSSGPMTAWWNDLGRPELTPKLKQTILDGVLQEAGDRSVEQLAHERDEALLGLIRIRRKLAEATTATARRLRPRKKT
jgi:3-hydroxyacyl-CoA dehydrogenase